MNTYKIYYTTKGTVYESCKCWIDANSEDEAIKKCLSFDFYDLEVDDTEYEDDYEVINIESVEKIENDFK